MWFSPSKPAEKQNIKCYPTGKYGENVHFLHGATVADLLV